jgi:RNA polymerase sigma-70 factor (ECF subfamily)
VADALDTSGANARQLASRAREHLRARRPKARIQRAQHEKLLWAFLQACTNGDEATLLGMLKQDAVLYSDGGGKVRAAINPILGADRIVRFILGLREKGIGELRAAPAEVNGEPGAAITRNGQPYMIHAIEVVDDRIQTIFYVVNPEKLPADFPVTTWLRPSS